jgi:hypothetical protein
MILMTIVARFFGGSSRRLSWINNLMGFCMVKHHILPLAVEGSGLLRQAMVKSD